MMKYITIVILLLTIFSSNCVGQDCSDFNRWAECHPRINNYSVYLQPKSIAVGVNDTLKFNVVFDSNKDYILSFCANNLYFPIKVRLLKPGTKEEIYDNAVDGYPTSIGIGFYKTQNMIIEISLMANKLGTDKQERHELVCVGMIMHWKKIVRNIN